MLLVSDPDILIEHTQNYLNTNNTNGFLSKFLVWTEFYWGESVNLIWVNDPEFQAKTAKKTPFDDFESFLKSDCDKSLFEYSGSKKLTWRDALVGYLYLSVELEIDSIADEKVREYDPQYKSIIDRAGVSQAIDLWVGINQSKNRNTFADWSYPQFKLACNSVGT